MERSERQKTLQIHSEHSNFECRGTPRDTEHTLQILSEKLIVSAMERAETQKTLEIFSGYCGRDWLRTCRRRQKRPGGYQCVETGW